MQISGPSLSGQPSSSNTWWTSWLSAVQSNKIPPEQYSWHIEGDINNPIDDLQTNNATLKGLLQQYSLPARLNNVNEYAVFDEQVSAGAAWWIARLERYDTVGLRGNWLSKYALHDFLASLLGKPNADSSNYNPTGGNYYPNGEFQVYKYYSQSMQGQRVATTGTGDRLMDVYATRNSTVAKVLTGVRLRQGTWYITVKGLSALGLPTSGSIPIHTLGFVDKGHFGQVDAPTDRGVFTHTYSGDAVTFAVYQTAQDEHTAWSFEINVK